VATFHGNGNKTFGFLQEQHFLKDGGYAFLKKVT
jgi:hypothetical protein